MGQGRKKSELKMKRKKAQTKLKERIKKKKVSAVDKK